MKQCKDFEQMIDDPARLGGQPPRELIRHLEGCPQCTEYMRRADQVMALLRPLQLRLSVTSERAYDRLRDHRRQKRQQMSIALAGGACATIGVLWFLHRGDPWASLILAAWVVLLGWRVWRVSRKAQLFAVIDEDLFATWRHELDWRIRTIRFGGVWLGLETLVIVSVFVREGDFGLRTAVAVLAALCVLGYIIQQFLITLPRLRRERRWIAESVQ